MMNDRIVLLGLLLVGGCYRVPAPQTRADASVPTIPSADASSDSPDASVPTIPSADAGSDLRDAGDDLDMPPVSTPPQLLLKGSALYPRVIRLNSGAAAGTIVASVVAPQTSGHPGGTILVSHDDGVSFAVAGHIDDDPLAAGGLCCATLFELPRAVGSLAAGTLLWAASVGGEKTQLSQPMSIPVWSSVDVGQTWTRLGTVVTATVPHSSGGLWEPEFAVLADGTLVCHYSDETDPAHSQKLVEARSSDGITWGSYTNTVALTTTSARPGMANVRLLPNSTYLMTYELCRGVAGADCAVHLRFSSDGWNWGDPNDPGLQPTTVDGMYFAHAPTIVWSDRPGANGRWYLVGQMVYDSAGSVAPGNGSVLFSNSEGGTNNWYEIAAPIPVAVGNNIPYDSCPNYSSSILPLDNGQVGLELATRREGSACHAYFARGPLLGSGDASGVGSGDRKRLVNVMSGLCLDASSGSGGAIRQATCNGMPAQSWSFIAATDGNFTLKAQSSGQCLTGANAGGGVTQQTCDASATQSWTLHNVGVGSYVLTHAATSACLDDTKGSMATGNPMQLWSCNDLSPQIWNLQSP
jgi:hypothetical protein